ncbi:MAG: hypothetical protein WCE54_10910 [Ignavibacteriaceae bacterium]
MQKIIIQIGLLFFFLAVIFFAKMGLPIQDVLLRSIILFLALTILISAVTLIFVRLLHKTSYNDDN